MEGLGLRAPDVQGRPSGQKREQQKGKQKKEEGLEVEIFVAVLKGKDDEGGGRSGDGNDHDHKPQTAAWPDWLPNDWTIWRSPEDNPNDVVIEMHYCNPEGKRFGSREEVEGFLARKRVRERMMRARPRTQRRRQKTKALVVSKGPAAMLKPDYREFYQCVASRKSLIIEDGSLMKKERIHGE